MSQQQQGSNDAFFQNFGASENSNARPRAPPPPPPRRNPSSGGSSSNNKPGPGASATLRRPIAPVPRPASGSGGLNAAAAARAAPPAPQPSTATATAAVRGGRSSSNSASGAQQSSVLAPARSNVTSTRPRPTSKNNNSRPVGNYYNSGAAATLAPPQIAAPTPNFYSANASMMPTAAAAVPLQQHPHPAAPKSNDSASDWFSSSSPTNNVDAPYNNFMAGSMDNSNGAVPVAASLPPMMATHPSQPSTSPSYFIPTAQSHNSLDPASYYEDIDSEPPLLEELGINIEHIVSKTKAVALPSKRFSKTLTDPALIVQDADLAGPLALALLLGGELLLAGKLSFGVIYGFGLFGCLSMTLVLNLMSPQQAVSVWTVTSVLGYALLPVNVLAAVKLLLHVVAGGYKITIVLVKIWAMITILWSTLASTRLLEVGCDMRNQRYLIAYPIAMLYSAFVLITIF